MHYIYRKKSNNNTIIYVKGRLESVNKLIMQIPELDINMKEDKKDIVLDLSEAEFISEETLKYFQRLKTRYNIPIRFKNYSLYIEMRLEEFNLLD